MKGFFVVLAIGLVACVQGQEEQCAAAIAKVPDCARSCIRDAADSVGCQPNDLSCPCSASQSAAIRSAAIGCVLDACGAETGIAAQTVGDEICSCAATAAAAPASTSAAAETSASPDSSAKPASTTTAGGASKTPASGTASSSPTATASRSSAISASSASGTAPAASATPNSAASFTVAAAQAIGSAGGVLGAFVIAMWAL